MAAPDLSFTSTLETVDNLHFMVLSDTTDYLAANFTVLKKRWLIVESNGSTTTKVDTGGDIKIPLLKDLAAVVKLQVNYDTNIHEKSAVVLSLPFLTAGLYDMRKNLMDLYMQKCKASVFDQKLKDLNRLSFFEMAAKNLVSTDLAAAQQALDSGRLELENINQTR